MSRTIAGSRMEFEFLSTKPQPRRLREGDAPFRILLMGDLGGAARGLPSRAVPVDVDNLDKVIASLDVQVRLPVGDGSDMVIPIRSIDGFHSDQLYRSLPVFQALANLRQRLSSPGTFHEAAAQVRALTGMAAPPATPQPAAPAESDAQTLERLLGRPTREATGGGSPPDLGAMLNDIVKPHIVPGEHAGQAELIALVEQAIAAQMRAILHHPRFQAIEAAWRGTQFAVSRTQTDETLKLYLVDAPRRELENDLMAADDLQATAMYKLLVEQSTGVPGAQPWALLVGDYRFGSTDEDVGLLARLGLIAQAAGAPLVAGACDQLVGCESVGLTPDPSDWNGRINEDLWNHLRGFAAASSIGLVFPRFLLRLPYGKQTEPTDVPGFEEVSERFGHEQYLWGNGAMAVAVCLAGAFRTEGWEFSGGGEAEIADLPLHWFNAGGEKQVKPCAEAWLTERAAARIHERGLMPLLSIRGRDAALLAGIHSIATDGAGLAGRWGH